VLESTNRPNLALQIKDVKERGGVDLGSYENKVQ
jgi:hypothetical protein